MPAAKDSSKQALRQLVSSDRLDAELRPLLAEWRAHPSHGRELVTAVKPERDHIRGQPSAPVTVVEYGCVASRGESVNDAALRQHLRPWIERGQVCCVFRHLPLIVTHPAASFAAQALEAAACQGRFWELHDALTDALIPRGSRPLPASGLRRLAASVVEGLRWLVTDQHSPLTPQRSNTPEPTADAILAVARRVGLDVDRLLNDMRRPAVLERILQDVRDGARSGVNGAPTFYIQGIRQDTIEADEVSERIEHALAGDRAALWPTSHEPAMARVEIAKRWHEAINAGEPGAAALSRGWDEGIEWNGWNEELPAGGSASGRSAVEELHRRPRTGLRSFRAAARDYIEHGERVLVLGHLHCEHADGEFHVPYAQVWEFHAGKARRVEALTDTLQVATALSGQDRRPTGAEGAQYR